MNLIEALQKWDRDGILMAYRTPTNRRYYTHSQYLEFTGKKTDDIDKKIVLIDYKTTNEQIFHCGASSKDGGNKVTTISLGSDNEIYHQLIDQL